MRKQRSRAVGLGMAGVGALMAAAYMVIDDRWLLLTGSAFVLVGLVTFFVFGWGERN